MDQVSSIYVTIPDEWENNEIYEAAKHSIDNYLAPYVPGLEFYLLTESEYE